MYGWWGRFDEAGSNLDAGLIGMNWGMAARREGVWGTCRRVLLHAALYTVGTYESGFFYIYMAVLVVALCNELD